MSEIYDSPREFLCATCLLLFCPQLLKCEKPTSLSSLRSPLHTHTSRTTPAAPAAGPGRARMSHTVRTESEGTCTPSVLYPSDVRTPLAAYGLRDAHPACAIHTNTRLTHNTEKSESEHFAHDKEQPRLALHIQSSTQSSWPHALTAACPTCLARRCPPPPHRRGSRVASCAARAWP